MSDLHVFLKNDVFTLTQRSSGWWFPELEFEELVKLGLVDVKGSDETLLPGTTVVVLEDQVCETGKVRLNCNIVGTSINLTFNPLDEEGFTFTPVNNRKVIRGVEEVKDIAL